ncbi:hypothetical protein HGRIS_011000 [Hohenbuehelia grisea]|uniref:Secreted protein n=1 Tax=Hohenbuehelia grisea TaxID=104357 RepID=A0ABR3IYM2_9AGAR
MKLTQSLFLLLTPLIVHVQASPMGGPSEPRVLPVLALAGFAPDSGLLARALPQCSMTKCGGDPPRNTVCCGGWGCIRKIGTCYRLPSFPREVEESVDGTEA